MTDSLGVGAMLGPTNTGKTHRAIERMLEHRTGMIGLPLRLLAREVYDRVSARLGESQVALVTGEERRVPSAPSYWVCTVEAMPLEREVDFLAVDEIQLAAHTQRGHVFTSRLLHARGRLETCFLGADTMRELVMELAGTTRIATHPRLSKLAFTGAVPLSRVPPRSAVVAFSMKDVYELAERMRVRRGGAAVVLGALSPRARNAQVAMFQAGEVDYLVATDAIGMGLNLDLNHVAFASLRKFDGKDVRELEPGELAQIAGRAGRYLRDGTFGTLAPIAMPPPSVAAIELHRFPQVRRVQWRNDDLDFSSLEALTASLSQRPPRRNLVAIVAAEDAEALERLSRSEVVRTRARDEDAIRLLWEVCRIPDFEKLLFESHLAFLEEVFVELVEHGRLSSAFVRARFERLADDSGDIDTLVARIAAVRTWSYVSHRQGWVDQAQSWRARASDVEDMLSDALHERLVQRFVETKQKRRASTGHAANSRPSETEVGDHPFASLRDLKSALFPGAAPPEEHGYATAIIDAPHERFALDARGFVLDPQRPDDPPLGRLVRGTSPALPDVALLAFESLGAGARSQIERRLVAFARDTLSEVLGPLRQLPLVVMSPAARGVAYALERGLGTATTTSIAESLEVLPHEERRAFDRHGITIGRLAVYVRSALRGRAPDVRLVLARVGFGYADELSLPARSAVSAPARRDIDPRAYAAIGFLPVGPRIVRVDIAERIAQKRSEGTIEPSWVASTLGCPKRDAERVLAAVP